MLFEILLNKLKVKMTIEMLSSDKGKVILDELKNEILKLSAEGYTISEISKKLNVSDSSVRYHRGKICEFLEAKNMTHAITKAVKNQCLDLLKII